MILEGRKKAWSLEWKVYWGDTASIRSIFKFAISFMFPAILKFAKQQYICVCVSIHLSIYSSIYLSELVENCRQMPDMRKHEKKQVLRKVFIFHTVFRWERRKTLENVFCAPRKNKSRILFSYTHEYYFFSPMLFPPEPCSLFHDSLSLSRTRTQIKNFLLHHETVAKTS